MMADEVGKTLLNTKKGLKAISSDLKLLQNSLALSSPNQEQRLRSRIQNRLKKFDGALQSKVDNVISDAMLNKEKTLNYLPLIQTDDYFTSTTAIMKNPSNSTTNATLSRKNTNSAVSMKFPQALLNNRVNKRPSTSSQKILKSQLESFKTNSRPRSRPVSGVSIGNKARKSIPTFRASDTQQQYIHGYTPIASRLSEANINKGVINLINRGVVPRDFDVGPAFEHGSPPFFSQKVKFYRQQPLSKHGEPSDWSLQPFNSKDDSKSIESSQLNTSTKMGRSYSRGMSYSRRESTLGSQKRAINQIDDYQTSYHLTKDLEHPQQNYINRSKDITVLGLNRNGGNSKQYEDLLDEDLEYEFTIQNGKTIKNTPEYIAYQSEYAALWSPILRIIELLETILSSYGVKAAYINGKKLASLASIFSSKPSLEQLLECIINQEDVSQKMKIPSLMFKGKKGPRLAAIKIQTFWRMFHQTVQFRKLRTFLKKIMMIQRCIRVYLKHIRTKKQIKEIQESYLQKYKKIAEKFRADWPTIKTEKRVEIHICNLIYHEAKGLSFKEFFHQQNLQISRLFALNDALVEVIYVAPYNLPPEVLEYYLKLMKLKGVPNPQGRIHVLWPDSYKLLPKHFSVVQALLYSFKTLKSISKIIEGKNAYIVPGSPSNDYTKLSAVLGVPAMSGEPKKHAHLSKNSEARSLFQSCGIPIPPGSSTIKTQKKFIETFTNLVADNLAINTWIFKIDHEIGEIGYAWCSVDSIQTVQEIKSEILQCYEDKEDEDIIESLVNELKSTVATSLPSKIRFARLSMYKNYADFMKLFTQKGGIIEACPNHQSSQINSVVINMFIDPAGSVKLLGSYDKILTSEFTTAGYFFPQKSLKSIDLSSFCNTIGQALYNKDAFGYFSIDLVVFPESKLSMYTKDQKLNKLYWGVGISCWLTNTAAITGFFDFLMNGKLNPISGRYTISKNSQEEKRCFAYFPIFHHLGLSNLQTRAFFQLCRANSVSYDIQTKEGLLFILLDSVQTGVMGLLAAAKSKHQVVKYIHDAFTLILQQTGNPETKVQSLDKKAIADNPAIADIMKPLSVLQKLYEKKYRTVRPFF